LTVVIWQLESIWVVLMLQWASGFDVLSYCFLHLLTSHFDPFGFNQVYGNWKGNYAGIHWL